MQRILSLLKALKRCLGPGGWTWLGMLLLLCSTEPLASRPAAEAAFTPRLA